MHLLEHSVFHLIVLYSQYDIVILHSYHILSHTINKYETSLSYYQTRDKYTVIW